MEFVLRTYTKWRSLYSGNSLNLSMRVHGTRVQLLLGPRWGRDLCPRIRRRHKGRNELWKHRVGRDQQGQGACGLGCRKMIKGQGVRIWQEGLIWEQDVSKNVTKASLWVGMASIRFPHPLAQSQGYAISLEGTNTPFLIRTNSMLQRLKSRWERPRE